MIKKILIQTVGTGGPGSPVWKALAKTYTDSKPDLLVWWGSQTAIAKTKPLFLDALGDLAPSNIDNNYEFQDVRDVVALTIEFKESIDKLVQTHPSAVIELDFTSGHKPMIAAAVMASVAKNIHTMRYALGEFNEFEQITETKEIQLFSPGPILADRQIHKLGQLFNLGQYKAVYEESKDLLKSSDWDLLGKLTNVLRARATSLMHLADAYECWDRFNWKTARYKFRNIKKREDIRQYFIICNWDMGQVNKQHHHLTQCMKVDQVAEPQRLADLLANVDRCIKYGRYDDAVARLYRLLEYVLQVRFFRINPCANSGNANNPTNGVAFEIIQKLAPLLGKDIIERNRNDKEKVSLGLVDTMNILAEHGDHLAMKAKGLYDTPNSENKSSKGPLWCQLNARNESLLAHGTVSVEKKVATDLRKSVKDILKEHLLEDTQSLEDLLKVATFVECPWSKS